jgi:integrative and conjugative element protein (TIGR02256 family)
MNVVWLDARARAHIEREALKRRLCETGGALFGWESDGALVVACASGPGTRAKHRPRRFEAHRATTAAVMRAVAVSSQCRYGYLGTWHTHPRGAPSPSWLDSETAGELAAQDDLLLPRPLLLILSTTGQAWTVRPGNMRAWRWDPERQRLHAAELVPCQLADWYCPDQPLFGGGRAATGARQSS